MNHSRGCCCNPDCDFCGIPQFEVSTIGGTIEVYSDCVESPPGTFTGYSCASCTYALPSSLTLAHVSAGIGCAYEGCSEWVEGSADAEPCADNGDGCEPEYSCEYFRLRFRLCGRLEVVVSGQPWELTLWVELECMSVCAYGASSWTPCAGPHDPIVTYEDPSNEYGECPSQGEDWAVQLVLGTPQVSVPTAGDPATDGCCGTDACALGPEWRYEGSFAWPSVVQIAVP